MQPSSTTPWNPLRAMPRSRPALTVPPEPNDYGDPTTDMPVAGNPESPETVETKPDEGSTSLEVAGSAPHATSSTSGVPEAGSCNPPDPGSADFVHNRVVGSGTVLRGRYQLEQQIGTGGFSLIFRAIDTYRQSAGSPFPWVAIKLLKPEFRTNTEAVARLQHEFSRLETLLHPNISHALDLDREGNIWFLVLELLEGAPLSGRLSRQPPTPLPKKEILRIIECCGGALDFAHGRGILHCDFKPGNILITQTDEIKVIDFGAAFNQYSPPAGQGRHATPAYASPETLAAETPDVRDDVFSFAVVVYELLAGKRPALANAPLSVQGPTLIPERPAGLSRHQWRTLLQCLSPVRASRPASVRPLIEAFKSRSRVLSGWFDVLAGVTIASLLLNAMPVPIPGIRASARSQEGLPFQADPGTEAPQTKVDDQTPSAVPSTEPAPGEISAGRSEPLNVAAPTRTTKLISDLTWISLDQAAMTISQPTAMAAMILQRNAGPARRAQILWKTLPGTALPGIDYADVPEGVVQFADNQNVSALYVPLVRQEGVPGDRTFYIEITSAVSQVNVGPITRVAVTIRGQERPDRIE